MTVAVTCPHCGASNPPGAAFCESCGKAMPSASPGGPRVVTADALPQTAIGHRVVSDELMKQQKKASTALLIVGILQVTCGAIALAVVSQAAPAGTVKLGIRPEHLVLKAAGQGQLAATVSLTETLGGDAYLYVRLNGGQTLVVRAEGDTVLDHGAVIGLDLPAHRQHHFGADGRTLASGGVAA